MRMEQIENAVNRVMQQHRYLCRLMHRGEVLPWSTEEMGWQVAQLNPDTVFVAEQEGKACGLIIAAEIHGTLFLVRMLGGGGEWVRPLWRFVRLVCFQRKIAGVWMLAENQNEAERKLLKLLPRDFEQTRSEERNTILFAGRWNYAGTSSNSVAGATVDSSERGSRPGNDGLQPGVEQREQQQSQLVHNGSAAGGADGGAAEGDAGGGDCEPGQHSGPDRREPHPDCVSYIQREIGRGSVRSQLRDAVFGGQRQQRIECADLGRHDDAEQQHIRRHEQSATA
jgi:hypothetical protein